MLAITETKKIRKGLVKLHTMYRLLWSKVDKEKRVKEGVELIITLNRLKDAIKKNT